MWPILLDFFGAAEQAVNTTSDILSLYIIYMVDRLETVTCKFTQQPWSNMNIYMELCLWLWAQYIFSVKLCFGLQQLRKSIWLFRCILRSPVSLLFGTGEVVYSKSFFIEKACPLLMETRVSQNQNTELKGAKTLRRAEGNCRFRFNICRGLVIVSELFHITHMNHC